MLKVGDKAPAFTLPDQQGKQHTLKDQLDSWVLLYFYPKDMTPGCTKQACGLRDAFSDYKKAHITIFGISKDSVESHKRFADTYDLPFPLLSDPSTDVLNTYGVWKEKRLFGNTFMGIVRSSYLIDPKGVIAKIYPKASPSKHADRVLQDVAELSTPSANK